MNFRDYCTFVREQFRPRHTHLYQLHDGLVARPIAQAVRAKAPAALRAVAPEVHPGVHVFKLLPAEFCRDMVDELAWIETWCARQKLAPIRPNTMNHYGAVLDIFGFAPFLRQLMCTYVTPLATLFFPEVGGATLDSHHGFVVEYQPGKDVKLDFHVDTSEVTLNVCLGKEFTGGNLYFRGVRCSRHQETPWTPAEDFEVGHRPGQAILHRGRHRHGAHPIISGQRHNLILWCRSSTFSRAHVHPTDDCHCESWCGWHGRSQAV